MSFWRNQGTAALDSGAGGTEFLQQVLARVHPLAGDAPERAVSVFFDKLSGALDTAGMARGVAQRWWLQEVAQLANTLSLNLVVNGTERRTTGSLVGGGVGFWLEWNGGVSVETSVYLHRLVCTNGMIRKIEACARFEARDFAGLGQQLEVVLPKALRGTTTGFDSLGRSYQVGLGLLRPIVPVVLDYLGAADPDRQLILDAFAAEPGDTLGHFINAFSRAANLMMTAHGVPAEVAFAKRRRLQTASMAICDTVLDRFTSGQGFLAIARDLRGVLESAG